MGKRKIKRKRRREQEPSRQAIRNRALRRARQMGNPIVIRSDSEAGALESMSEVMEELAEPLLETAESHDDERSILLMAILSWNLALLPETKREKEIEELICRLCGDDEFMAALTELTVRSLVARKQELFPDIDRVIVDYDVDVVEDSVHLVVVSTVPPDAATGGMTVL